MGFQNHTYDCSIEVVGCNTFLRLSYDFDFWLSADMHNFLRYLGGSVDRMTDATLQWDARSKS
eukprot:609916-Pyramimonas_sp.AAC.3